MNFDVITKGEYLSILLSKNFIPPNQIVREHYISGCDIVLVREGGKAVSMAVKDFILERGFPCVWWDMSTSCREIFINCSCRQDVADHELMEFTDEEAAIVMRYKLEKAE